MSMNFGIPKNEQSAPLRNYEPLRAEGNLSYPQFIQLVERLWEDTHPDIKFFPASGKQFSRYPVIVYSILVRKPIAKEPKQKYRDTVSDDEGNLYRITAQRFDNLVGFTVITKTDPKLADAIMEEFEDFMHKHTPVFKRLGVSDMFYSRRLPDTDEQRMGDDSTRRTVAYLVTTEKVSQMAVDRIEEIAINVRLSLEAKTSRFHIEDTSNHLIFDGRAYEVGQKVKVSSVIFDEDNSLPRGLHSGWVYTIASIGSNFITLANEDGSDLIVVGPGQGKIDPWQWVDIPVEIIDDLSGGEDTP